MSPSLIILNNIYSVIGIIYMYTLKAKTGKQFKWFMLISLKSFYNGEENKRPKHTNMTHVHEH